MPASPPVAIKPRENRSHDVSGAPECGSKAAAMGAWISISG